MLFYHIPSKKATPFVLPRARKPKPAKTEGRTPLRRSEMRLLPSAAAVVVAATAAAAAIVQQVAVVTAAAEQEDEDDDPPAAAKTVRVAIHNQEPPVSVMSSALIPCYDGRRKR